MNLSFEEYSRVCAKLDKVVAINVYGRSGSMFLQSLLDNHPQVITIPGVYMAFYYQFYHGHNTLPTKVFIERLVEQFAVFFDARDNCFASFWNTSLPLGQHLGFTQMGDERKQTLSINKEAFIACLTALLIDADSVDRKRLFQALHIAYQYAQDPAKEISEETVIAFHLHEHMPTFRHYLLEQDFPNCKYIQVVREPLRSLQSWFQSFPKANMEEQLDGILIGGIASGKAVYERSRVVKIEDINADSRQVLEKICQWIDISWNDCLLESTFHGLTWWGDAFSKPATGFGGREKVQQHASSLSAFDRWRLSYLLAKKYKVWNYCPEKWQYNTFLKFLSFLFLLCPLKHEIDQERLFAEDRRKNSTLQTVFSDFRYGFWWRWWRLRRLLYREWFKSLDPNIVPIRLL